MDKYTHPGIKPRGRQHFDSRLFEPLGEFTGIRGTPATATVVQTGEGLGYQGFNDVMTPIYYFEVTLKDGTVVPAYSYTPGLAENGYMICQNFAYKAFFPQRKVRKSRAKVACQAAATQAQ